MTRYMDAKQVEEVDRKLEAAGQAFTGRRHLRAVPMSSGPRKPKVRIPTEAEMYANSTATLAWIGQNR